MSDENETTTESAAENWSRSRLEDIKQVALAPESLVGSWCHKLEDDEFVWQGLVVGEPQPGLYQVELFDWIAGKGFQRLIRAEDMAHSETATTEWRFYDTEEWMRMAFDHPPKAVSLDSVPQ